MRFVDSLFGSTGSNKSRTSYSVDDAFKFAKPFIGAGISEALVFGELARSRQSAVLSVAFLAQAPEFRDYIRRLDMAAPQHSSSLVARKEAFSQKWGYLKPEYLECLPGREPFAPDHPPHIYVLPLGWRNDIRNQQCASDLRRRLREEHNKKFFEDLKTTLIVPT